MMVSTNGVRAEVVLPDVFSDNMVLQQGVPVKIWGQAGPEEEVSVSFGSGKAAAKADADGKWQISLPARKASKEPATLVVKGSNEIVFHNVLVGEVWLCSGQSNMSMGLLASEGADAEIATADHPLIRLFITQQTPETAPRWKVCTPESILEDGERHKGWPDWRGFSAVGYYFGKKLQQDLDVPVGLIQAAVGGSAIQAWLVPDGGLYKSMVQPLVPFPIRGVIWYQGEANYQNPQQYLQMSKDWIQGWRAAWQEPGMPVYITQIAPHEDTNVTNPYLYPEFWEVQAQITREIPGFGIVGTTDVANLRDIHPRKKKAVGQRLALQALRKTYDRKDIVADGPVFRSLVLDGSRVRVIFDNVPTGLKTRDGKAPNWFEIRDAANEEFVPAHAEIDGKSVVLSAPGVRKPYAVRFGWSRVAEPNLESTEGLPAYPFRSIL